MRSVRFSIAGLMAIVLVMALGLAALRNPLASWAGLVPLATRGIVCVAVVGAVCRTGPERAWWLGFALCAWTYLNYFSPLRFSNTNPINVMLQTLGPMMGVPMDNPGRGEWGRDDLQRSFLYIGQCLWALTFAMIGGFLGWVLFGVSHGGTEQNRAAAQPAPHVLTNRWVLPSAILVTGVVLISAISLASARLAPGLWAGMAYLLTWWLLGLTALGTLFGRGRSREFWLGATLFGGGFLLLVFSHSQNPYYPYAPPTFLPTVRFLEALRPQFGNVLSRLNGDPESALVRESRIFTTLERRVPLHFPQATSLKDFLTYIRDATRSPDGKVIPIYVDPVGLAETDKNMDSRIEELDLEDVELRTSLRLVLKHLDLDYVVKDGMLLINSQDALELSWRSIEDDPYQTVGHCLLALFAAVLGGFAAPLVCDLSHRRTG